MKILYHYPDWSKRWTPYIKDVLSDFDLTISCTNNRDELLEVSKECDVLLSMWANEVIWLWTYVFPEKRIISYLRRYEIFFNRVFSKILWNKVDDLIFINTYLKDLFAKKAPDYSGKSHLIYNGIDLSEFKIDTSNRTGSKIAMMCKVDYRKGMFLACQILLALPKEYKIYLIGKIHGINRSEFECYLKQLGLKDRFIIEGEKKPSEVPGWLADKDFILSTAISEGNPVNVLEGMAMGLKPVVHRFPGAEEQFEDFTFYTVREARNMIMARVSPKPEFYRSIVRDKYSTDNYKQLYEIINGNT